MSLVAAQEVAKAPAGFRIARADRVAFDDHSVTAPKTETIPSRTTTNVQASKLDNFQKVVSLSSQIKASRHSAIPKICERRTSSSTLSCRLCASTIGLRSILADAIPL